MAGLLGDIQDLSRDGRPYVAPSVAEDMPPRLMEFIQNTDAIFGRGDVHALSRDLPAPETYVEGLNQDLYRSLIENARNGHMTAHPFIDENGTVKAVVVASDDVDGFKNRITRGNPENYPGTDSDWYSYSLLHEDAHGKDGLSDGKMLPPSKIELYADHNGTREYYRAYREGVVSDPEVPYAMVSKRAIDIMLEVENNRPALENHGHAVLSPLPGESAAALSHYTTGMGAGKDVVRARGDIYEAIGADHYSNRLLSRDVMRAVNEAIEVHGMPVDPELREEIRSRASPFLDIDETPEQSIEADQAVFSKMEIPEDFKPLIAELAEKNMRETKIGMGEFSAMIQPELLYETTRRLSQSGHFNDNPAGQQFADRFIDGVQRYEPDKYGVAPEDRPTQRPEIVDRLAEQYAPVLQPTHNVAPSYAQ